MRSIQHILLAFILAGSAAGEASSQIIKVENLKGEHIEIGINNDEPFFDVLEKIQSYFQQDSQSFCQQLEEWNLNISYAGLSARTKKENWRDYHQPITAKQKQSLHYIMTTLARSSIFTLAKEASSLKKAGICLELLHPYQFLIAVFEDEELKASLASIRDRGAMVKSNFFDEMHKGLREESERNNLFQFTSHFAKRIKIEEELITPLLKQAKWDAFIDVLIEKIPRATDPNRYNM